MDSRDLSSYTAYRAGRGVEEVARDLGLDPDDLVKLSSNENPFGPSPAAVEAIREAAGGVHQYPKAVHTDLTAAIAEEWRLDSEQVWLGPGADGAIDLLSRAMLDPGDRVLVPEPGFAYYPMSARYHAGTVDTYPLHKHEDFRQTPAAVLDSYDDHRMIYLTTPHNPTGSELSLAGIREVAAETGEETLIVVDEAYGVYTDAPSARELLDDREDVAVLRTFSKSHGLAGLRVGYTMVPSAWAGAYDLVNTPFAVNTLACVAGLAALDDDDHLERTVETIRWARSYVHDHLAARTWESGGNFVLAEVGDAQRVADTTRRRGVIVRDCTSFGLPECIRISCGTRQGTKRAVEVVNEVLEG
ncbi:MAG: histidinol-phosphate transaminase [Salinirussus sp.]